MIFTTMMLFLTYLYQNTSAGSCLNASVGVSGLIGLYTCASSGLSAAIGYNFALGIGLTAFFFVLIAGILAVRQVDIINAVLVAAFFNIILSLLFQQIGILGSGTIVLWIGLAIFAAFISLLRGAQKPYG